MKSFKCIFFFVATYKNLSESLDTKISHNDAGPNLIVAKFKSNVHGRLHYRKNRTIFVFVYI